MRKIKTIRDYNSFFIFLLSLVVLGGVHIWYNNQLTHIETNYDKLDKNLSRTDRNELWNELIRPLRINLIDGFDTIIIMITVVFGFITIYLIFKSNIKELMFISLFTNSYIAYLCVGEGQTPEYSFIFYLLATPFIVNFYDKFLVGKTVDFTDKIELEILKKSNSKIESLKQLKNANLIDENEFNLKLRNIYKDQLIEEEFSSEELKHIKKASDEKIISKEEFLKMYDKIIEKEIDNRIINKQ